MGAAVVTGYASSYYRHKCAVNGCYYESLPNWDDFILAFPRSIRPTDIDGMVEINGHFLFLEEKREGKALDAGQFHAFKALAQQPRTTIAFIRPSSLGDLEVLTWEDGEPSGWQTRDRIWFADWLHMWATRADQACLRGLPSGGPSSARSRSSRLMSCGPGFPASPTPDQPPTLNEEHP